MSLSASQDLPRLDAPMVRAPELPAAAAEHWLDSTPLSLRALRGQVVLLDFWDFTCVNCLRTLPFVQGWHERYQPFGLQIIGVHTPEFAFARDPRQVQAARQRFGLTYPVVLDNDTAIWRAFANRAWPGKHLIDSRGYVRYRRTGEGGYHQTEQAVRALLQQASPGTVLPEPLVEKDGIEQDTGTGGVCLPVTPELYLGYARERFTNTNVEENTPKAYTWTAQPVAHQAELQGRWHVTAQHATALPLPDTASLVRVRYTASEVNVVAAPAAAQASVVRVLLDGTAPLPHEQGRDVREGCLRVEQPRLYNVVQATDVQERLLLLQAESPVSLYSFTFGGCPEPAA